MTTEPEPTQAQAAPAPTTDQNSTADAVEALATALVNGAPPAEIARLQAAAQPTEPEQSEAVAEPKTEQTPEEEAAADPTAEGIEPEPADEPAAGDEPPEDDDEVKVSNRPRLTHLSEPDKAKANAIILLTRSGLSLEEATQRVLGTVAAEPAEVVEPEPAVPGVAELETQLAAIEARIDTNQDGLTDSALTKEHGRIVRALAKAEAKALLDAEKAETGAQTRRQVLTEAAKVYPDLADSKSALWRMSAQISSELRADGDPRGSDPRHCADEAAKLLKIIPAGTRPAAALPSTPPKAAAPKPPGPAPGSRTTAPPPAARSEADISAEAQGKAMAAALGEKYVPGRDYSIDVAVR